MVAPAVFLGGAVLYGAGRPCGHGPAVLAAGARAADALSARSGGAAVCAVPPVPAAREPRARAGVQRALLHLLCLAAGVLLDLPLLLLRLFHGKRRAGHAVLEGHAARHPQKLAAAKPDAPAARGPRRARKALFGGAAAPSVSPGVCGAGRRRAFRPDGPAAGLRHAAAFGL